ncbi:aspartate-semialdehyde dehydrogenase [Leptospira gomenensis]|uniref:Aspartate-semialdehyde dehydrogenase n=1 Tax=Leptospira gomenensis TaxID=2484974 RepID=A0A5F1YXK9_9LEPT|nr:aspartate-semialdehyde dehydrogenase [Leptospira gomenensis]TGK38361.1 aspartate-semialdehyde dehydrogenase [Leptospira gomenensis]TGK39281.1 aspartate-semialdehyde dehydrogenase [Leptospira gomenensis]TGK52175.1 aspartate-semialdehyde dehydrogenase [Leptospira gomenensis]TGK62971.1 aspartate-semialdehyde dehydrogenase [Leptospira gomenensis]
MSRVKVAVLGATGSVGQRFIQLLDNHPYFEVTHLCASENSAGKTYGDVMKSRWKISSDIPAYAKNIVITTPDPSKTSGAALAFSGLDASIAGEVESAYANAGIHIISNSKNHRMDPKVPLLSAEVNASHLEVLDSQTTKGKIITNSNCTIMGVTITLKPLFDRFGIESVMLFSMQAISGAGYPGVPSMDILGNVVPHIGGEEEKAEIEPLKCLGRVENGKIVHADFPISAHCNRVPVFDGHTVCVSVKFKQKPSREEVLSAWKNFSGEPQSLALPSAPNPAILYREEEDRPQPRLDLNTGNGMTTVVGRLRPDPILDWKYVVLSHNTIRGAAGAALLNAELLYKKNFLG